MSDPARRPINVQYIWAIAFMSLLIVATVLLINLIRPNQDNTGIITMVISSLGSTTVSLLALLRTNDTHRCVREHIEGKCRASRAPAERASLR